MLQLQQEGFLERMTEKWFRSRSVCSAETQAAQATAEEGGDQLRFIDMAGVFITLAVGIVAGMVVLLVELIYASYKDTKSKDSMVSYVSLLAAFYFIVFSYLATYFEWSDLFQMSWVQFLPWSEFPLSMCGSNSVRGQCSDICTVLHPLTDFSFDFQCHAVNFFIAFDEGKRS